MSTKWLFGPMPQSDGGADFSTVQLGADGKPECRDHGAMNKVAPGPSGWWRCLAMGCRAGCAQVEQ